MHLHEYISQGLESILGALDIEGSYDKQRTITIATTPSVGALVLPVIYRAIKTHYPQLLLRNPPISDAENQLSQFQTDLIIDNMFCTNRTVQHHVLFTDNMVLICREGNPLLSLEDDRRLSTTLRIYSCYRKGKISAVCGREFKRCFRTGKSVSPATTF